MSLILIGLFAFVLMLANALKDLLGYVFAGQISVGTLLRLIALLVPFVASYALPVGILAGVLLVLGRMSSYREIIALRAAGISVASISAPILFFAVLGVGLNATVNFYLMPLARITYRRELAEALQSNPLGFIKLKTFTREFPACSSTSATKRGLR